MLDGNCRRLINKFLLPSSRWYFCAIKWIFSLTFFCLLLIRKINKIAHYILCPLLRERCALKKIRLFKLFLFPGKTVHLPRDLLRRCVYFGFYFWLPLGRIVMRWDCEGKKYCRNLWKLKKIVKFEFRIFCAWFYLLLHQSVCFCINQYVSASFDLFLH